MGDTGAIYTSSVNVEEYLLRVPNISTYRVHRLHDYSLAANWHQVQVGHLPGRGSCVLE